jgi:two-component system LytT family response regulator
MPIRVLLVDDEPLARQRLRQMLADHSDVSIAGEAEHVEQARELVRAERPDLILLDIRMPGADGFKLVESLHLTPMPYVIFVTAYSEHAVEAFDTEAVDYLLKPFDEERLGRALERARAAIARRAPTRYLERFAVTLGRRTKYVAAGEVDWIEGSGNYAKLHIGKEAQLVRTTLSALEQELDPTRFARVHRSAIVALDRVRELRSLGGGEFRVLLRDGVQVPMSQRYRDRLP